MENFLMIINRLHGTEGNPLAEDLSDSDYEEENREELHSRFIERRDKAWVARYILQCVRSDCTSAEFVKRVLEFPILLWPIFDLQQQYAWDNNPEHALGFSLPILCQYSECIANVRSSLTTHV